MRRARPPLAAALLVRRSCPAALAAGETPYPTAAALGRDQVMTRGFWHADQRRVVLLAIPRVQLPAPHQLVPR